MTDFDKEMRELGLDAIETTEQVMEEAREVDNKNYRGTQSRKGRVIKAKNNITFKQLSEKVENFIPNTTIALKITLAIAMSGTKKGSPLLWMILIGNPSSGKTDIATLIRKSVYSYPVDSMTMSAFITGERQTKSNKVHDLLPELNKKCLIIKDWTTLFSLYEEMTNKIIGDLVNIYDEEFTKFSATRGNVNYKSTFSHIGCITPATLNKHAHYLNMIGARFLFYSVPESNKEQRDKSFESIFSNKNRKKTKRKLTILTSKFLNKLATLSVRNIKPLSNEVKLYLRVSAEFIAKARGLVIMQSTSFKNDSGEDVTYYEALDVQIEEPWRAVQQLIRLSKYLALVEEKDEVGLEEMEIIKSIALSSMPANRAKALSIFNNKSVIEITAKDLSEFSEKSVKTSRRLLDELIFLGILEKDKGTGTIPNNYRLKEEFRLYVSIPPFRLYVLL